MTFTNMLVMVAGIGMAWYGYCQASLELQQSAMRGARPRLAWQWLEMTIGTSVALMTILA